MSDDGFDPMDMLNKLGGQVPGGLNGLLAQAQQMQAKMQDAQSRAAEQTVTGEAAGGLVKVTCNGHMMFTRVELDPQVVDARDIDMLQDLIVAAANDAVSRAKTLVESEMGPLANMMKGSGFGL